MTINLSSLTYYPIKSCRGIDVAATWVERAGLARDRRMMVVTLDGKFVTQREHSRLAWVVPTIERESLTLSARNHDSIRIPYPADGPTVPVQVWSSRDLPAVDMGEEAAEWLSDWLGVHVRLVQMPDGPHRKLNPQYAVRDDDHTGFADGYPILILSEESLIDLNSRLETPLPMNRFRPNLVVRGGPPFAEDTWKRIRIGDVEMAIVKPCPRCVVTTIDKETLEQRKEPLKTLATFRKSPGGVMFGQNAIPLNEGGLEVGMKVEVIA